MKRRTRKLAKRYGRAAKGAPRSFLRVAADEVTPYVIGGQLQATIAATAQEFVKEMLADEEFRRELKTAAIESAREVARSYRK